MVPGPFSGRTVERSDVLVSDVRRLPRSQRRRSRAWSRASRRSATLTSRGQAERVDVELVSGNTFDVLGRLADPRPRADAGRRPHARARIRWRVMSYSYWQRRFAGSPAVLNQVVTINSTPVTIVGVAPAGFAGVAATQIARPVHAADDEGAADADVERSRQPAQPLGEHRRPAQAGADAGRRQGATRRALSADQRVRAEGGAGVCRRQSQSFKERFRAKKLTLHPGRARACRICAQSVRHAALRADGDGRPRAADRVRQRRQPAAEPRDRAAAGNRRAPRTRRRTRAARFARR